MKSWFPVKEAAFGGKGTSVRDERGGGRLHFSSFDPLAAAPNPASGSARERRQFARCNFNRISVIAAKQPLAAEPGSVIGRDQPTRSVRQIEKGAHRRRRLFDAGKGLTATTHLADIRVCELLDARHSRCRLARPDHVLAEHQTIAFAQFPLDWTDEFAEQ